MGRGEKKEISNTLFPESQPASKNGVSLINSDTLSRKRLMAHENDLSSGGMV